MRVFRLLTTSFKTNIERAFYFVCMYCTIHDPKKGKENLCYKTSQYNVRMLQKNDSVLFRCFIFTNNLIFPIYVREKVKIMHIPLFSN